MNALKIVLFVVLGIVAIVLITALFVKKEYTVEKEIVINKSNPQVFSYVKFLKNQDNYSVWAKMDPNMKREYKGEDGTVGFVSVWKSEKKDVGAGEQEIKKLKKVNGLSLNYGSLNHLNLFRRLIC